MKFLNIIIIILTCWKINVAMALEEPEYRLIQSSDNYEIRKYDNRLAVEVEYSNEDSGFQYLFNYISGANTGSQKVEMTVPVTENIKIDMTSPVNHIDKANKKVMQFYLPKKFTIDNAPKPSNKKVKLVTIEGGYYAILRYSGRTSDRNYAKKLKELQKNLEKDNIEMLDQGSKAIFDGPFTLPLLRRNEVMIKISWSE